MGCFCVSVLKQNPVKAIRSKSGLSARVRGRPEGSGVSCDCLVWTRLLDLERGESCTYGLELLNTHAVQHYYSLYTQYNPKLCLKNLVQHTRSLFILLWFHGLGCQKRKETHCHSSCHIQSYRTLSLAVHSKLIFSHWCTVLYINSNKSLLCSVLLSLILKFSEH